MFKALYAFTIDDENGLSFPVGERFTVMDSHKDPHWWLVQNGTGKVGFVPANYLAKDDVSIHSYLSDLLLYCRVLQYTMKFLCNSTSNKKCI